MRKWVKPAAFAAAAAVLAVAWGVRFYTVNANSRAPIVQVYAKGQMVPVGKDYFNSSDEKMDGYAVKVERAELVSTAAYCARYGKPGDYLKPDGTKPGVYEIAGIYLVRILVRNDDNPYLNKKGIDLLQCSLRGTDYILNVNDKALALEDPATEGNPAFSLRTNSEKEFTVPYEILAGSLTLAHVKADPPRLIISAYPHEKLLRLY